MVRAGVMGLIRVYHSNMFTAFDNVWRVGLWQKLIQNGISGKCFDVIVKMYSECK